MTNDKATINVHIFVPQRTERYAKPNARNIVQISLINALGLNSITV